MNNKIFKSFLVAACLTTALTLGACGSSDDSAKTDESSAGEGESVEETAGYDGYEFEYKGYVLRPDDDFAPAAEALGEAKSTYEQPSCAIEGIAKIYDYGSVIIETYPDEDIDRICYVTLKDDTVGTKEGIDLSSSKDDIIAAYGDNYEETDTAISYKTNEMKLLFIFEGDNLASIEYDTLLLD